MKVNIINILVRRKDVPLIVITPKNLSLRLENVHSRTNDANPKSFFIEFWVEELFD